MVDLPQPQDDAGADREVDDRSEVVDDRSEIVDASGSKVFEMDRSNVIWTEGLGGFDGLYGGGHL